MSAPNNAVLANTVAPKDLTQAKKHLDHVALDKAEPTIAGGVPTGGVHLGPGKGQADFAPNSIHTHSSTSAIGAVSQGGNHVVEQAHSGEVSVQSSVTIDTTQESKPQAAAQIQALLSRLSTTTTQIDEYSRRANEQISAEANQKIQRIIAETQQQQDLLLKDASARSLEIEAEYSNKLKEFLQGLDASKASNLASLEKDLNFRQEQLLTSARDEMDNVHQVATQQKIGVMQNANQSAIRDVDRLTDQVKALGEVEVERRLASTTTTVITTQTTTDAVRTSPDVLVADKNATITHVEKRTDITVNSEPRSSTVSRI
jgi:vacuolar-type H+-ATPase subunit I/STV1